MAESNPFAGYGKAKPGSGGNYIQAGQHVFEIRALKYVVSENPKSKGDPRFVAELVTIKSTAHAPGENVSWIGNLKHTAALADMRALIGAALDLSEKDLEADDAGEIPKLAVSSEQPARGSVIACDAHVKKLQSGNPFTVCRFSKAIAGTY